MPPEPAPNPFDEIGTENPFDEIGPGLGKPDVSSVGAFTRAAGRSALPAAAGLAGAGAGAEVGAAAGLLGGPFAPVTVPVGGFLGGLGGFFLGSTAMEHAQHWALSKFPESWAEAIGQDDRQQRLDATHAPIASFMGALAPYALTMRPGGFSRAAVPDNATTFQRLMAHPATSRVFGGAAMGGIELGSEALGDEPIDWRKVAISTGFGVVFNKPTKFGEAISGLGARPIAAGVARLRGPTIAQANDAGVLGPGITEETFRGVQKRADEVAAAASDAMRQEAALLGDQATDAFGRRGLNVHDVARQMHPDLFADYDTLTARRDTLRDWVDEIGGAQAQLHLDATEKEIAKLEPQVQAAYRRAAEATGAPMVEPEAPTAGVPGAPTAAPALTTGRPDVDKVLGEPSVAQAIANPKINRANDVPYEAGASEGADTTTHLDSHIPNSVTISGKTFDPAIPANVHEQVEKFVMEKLIAGRKLSDAETHKIYEIAHHEYAEPAEDAWYKAQGIDVDEVNKWWAQQDKITEHENPANPPANLYKKPYPHNKVEGAKHEESGAALEWPTETKIGEAAPAAAAVSPAVSPATAAAPAATAEPPYATTAHKAAIAADVERQLTAAGRSPDEAKAGGAVVAARYAARASWLKGAAGTAEEMYRREGAEIRGPGGAAPAPAEVPQPTPPKIEAAQVAAAGISRYATTDQIAELRSMIGSKLPSDEIAAHPSVVAANADAEGRPDPFAKGLDTPEAKAATERLKTQDYQNNRQFDIDGKRVTGYRTAVDWLTGKAEQYSTEAPVAKDRKATIIMGPPAAGKSSWAEALAARRRAAIVDPDDAKLIMPEYDGGAGASQTHGESAFLSGQVFARLRDGGANLVLPRVGGAPGYIREMIDDLKAAGYTVDLVNMAVDQDEAYRRMIARFISTGRIISAEYFNWVDGNPEKTYQIIKGEGKVHETLNIDANGPKGSAFVKDGDETDLAKILQLGGYRGPDVQRGREGRGAQAEELTPQPITSAIPNGIASFSPSDLTVDAKRFQFKAGGDEAGVTDRLKGVTKWDPIKAGMVLVWQDANGKNFVVDGHQRHGLASRIEAADPSQKPQLLASVLRQSDGVSDKDARIIAALKNIAEGTGSAVDAAKVLREAPERAGELPPRSELFRQAQGLVNLSDDAFGMVINEVVPANYAAIVGRLVPSNPKLQSATLSLLAKTEPANAVQAESIVRQGIEAGIAKKEKSAQGGLFGDEDVAESLYIERAKVLDRAFKEIKKDKAVFSVLTKEQTAIEQAGNKLAADVNEKRAAADAQALQILQVLANRKGPVSDALGDAARDARTSGKYAEPVRSFVGKLRLLLERHELASLADGVERGPTHVGEENRTGVVEPAPELAAPQAEKQAAEEAVTFFQRIKRQPAPDLFAQREAMGQMQLPGAERIGEGELAQRAANAPLKPGVEQKPLNFGLFSDEGKQRELFQSPQERMHEAFLRQLAPVADQIKAEQGGISTVYISDLLARTGLPKDEVHAALLWGAQHGMVSLHRASPAEASLTAAQREGALDVEDQRFHTVLFKPAMATLLQGARGKIRLAEGRRPIITLMREANASTFIHESGHDFLEQLMRDSAHPAAPDQLKADADMVRNFVGAQPDGTIPTRGHEKFARGFEQYLREGVAPSKELAGVFAKFKQWLLSIYNTLKGLGSPINDDIRRVFDRMLAAEPQRTVIAPEEAQRPTLQDIHEADEAEHTPQTAEPAGRLVDSEREKFANNPPPEIANEIETEIQRTGAKPAAGTGEGGGRSGEVVEPGAKPEPEPEGRSVGAEQRPQRQGEPGPVGQGAEPAAAERGAGPAEQGAGDNPLAAKPADQFGPGQSFNVGKDGNVRAENISSVPQLVQAINEASDRIGGGGPITMGEMQSLADDVLLPVEKIDEAHLARVFGGIQNLSSKVWALRQTIRDSAQIVHDSMKKAAESQNPADLAAMAVAMTRHDMMQSILSSVTTETGRALGMGFRNLEGWEKAQDLGLFLKQNTGRTLYQLQATANLGAQLRTPGQISKFLRDARTRSFGGMILEYWINGLISGPTTHITYMIGNAILASMGVPETLLGAGVGKILGHTQGVRFGEAGAQIRGGIRGIPGAFEAAIEAARTGQTTLLPGEQGRPLMPFQGATVLNVARSATNDPVKWNEVGAAAFGLLRGIRDGFVAGAQIANAPLVSAQFSPLGQIPDIAVKGYNVLPIGTVARLPGRGVATIHSFFRSMNYSMLKAAEAYRDAANLNLTGPAFDAHVANVWQNPSVDMMERAREGATQTTLMGQGGEFVKALSRLTNATVDLPLLGETAPLKFIDPFVHIGANIIKQAIVERTPLGILSGEIRADLAGRNGQVAQEMAAGRMLAGTSLGLLFGGLAMQGYATGSGPKDPQKQAMWRLGGYQAHSVRIGDIWYDVHRLGPIGMLMGVAADMYDVAHEASQGQLMEAGAHLQHALTQNILDESFMRGPADLIRAIEDPGRYGEAYLRNFISSFVPYSVGMGQMARATDPYSRQARTVMDAIKDKVPGMSEQLFPRRDIWGEEIPNLDALAAKGVTSIYMRRISQDPVNIAMLNLGIAPAKLERKIRNVELTDAQYDDFARIAGRQTKMRLDSIARSPDWATWPPHVQHDVIVESIRQSREAARGMMMMKNPDIARTAVDTRMKRQSDESIVPLH